MANSFNFDYQLITYKMYNYFLNSNLMKVCKILCTRSTMMKTLQCKMCGWVYDEAKGIPDEGIIPGTAWADIPEDWTCPVCGSGKEDFEMVEI